MMLVARLAFAAILLAPVPAPARPTAIAATKGTAMFDEKAMDQLDFLIGRWIGTGPDGKLFYEEYDRPDRHTLRSRRFADGGFTSESDASTVVLHDGVMTSAWGEFRWKASRVETGLAVFEPINAPSTFSWKRIDAETVHVTQNWTDESGNAQTYTISLRRTR